MTFAMIRMIKWTISDDEPLSEWTFFSLRGSEGSTAEMSRARRLSWGLTRKTGKQFNSVWVKFNCSWWRVPNTRWFLRKDPSSFHLPWELDSDFQWATNGISHVKAWYINRGWWRISLSYGSQPSWNLQTEWVAKHTKIFRSFRSTVAGSGTAIGRLGVSFFFKAQANKLITSLFIFGIRLLAVI